jgi:serine/threonine protein kinase
MSLVSFPKDAAELPKIKSKSPTTGQRSFSSSEKSPSSQQPPIISPPADIRSQIVDIDLAKSKEMPTPEELRQKFANFDLAIDKLKENDYLETAYPTFLTKGLEPTELMSVSDIKYTDMQKLGSSQGNFGQIYLAKGPDQKQYAIKLMKDLSQEEMVASFKTELETMLEIRGEPGQTIVYDFILPTPQKPYAGIVMEFIQGKSLEQYCKEYKEKKAGPPLPEDPNFKSYIREWLKTGDNFHKKSGKSYNDMKGENLMVLTKKAPDGSIVKMLDYGTATKFTAEQETAFGTMLTMSPEMVALIFSPETGFLTAKSDLASQGLALCELITNLHPCSFFYFEEEPEKITANAIEARINYFLTQTEPKPPIKKPKDQEIIRFMGSARFKKIYSELQKAVSQAPYKGTWQELVVSLINPDPNARPSVEEALAHPWLKA